MNDLGLIKNILICPSCRGTFSFKQNEIACQNCNRIYPVCEDIPQFDYDSENGSDLKEEPAESKSRYEQRYVDFENAKNYNLKYKHKFLKRLSTRREYQIIKSLLNKQKHCETMLEIPCGGGRISPQLAGATDLLIQADIGLGQILYAMTRDNFNIPQIWMTASAFRIPLQDSSVDASVCIRLSHHLSTMKQRENLLVELLRVSRRYVIMTYFDYYSIKNILRIILKKKPKLTMTRSQISAIAAKHGAVLLANPQLSLIGSGHRYALLVKKDS
jgi:ubiquinone/menaquinone biosynthesis C-methylase UbiE